MSEQPDRSVEQRITAAATLLDAAREDDRPARAVQALVEIARAAEGLGWDLSRSEDAPVAARLRELAVRDEELISWAVLTVTNLLYGDDPYDLVEALLARSGWQVLHDLDVWPDSKLDPGHVADVDAELIDVVQERELAELVAAERPAAVPRSHGWWFGS